MTVKEVMKKAAVTLGIGEEINSYINSNGASNTKMGDLLLQCFNLVENELALDYVPLVKEERLTASDGKVYYSGFSSDVARILCVKNVVGEEKPFKLYATYLQSEGDMFDISYAYIPVTKVLSGTSDFTTIVSQRLLVFGMAAEYCMATGLYEEASVWDKKYKEGIEATRLAEPPVIEEFKEAEKEEEEETPTPSDPAPVEPETPEEEKPLSPGGQIPSRWWI